MTHFYFAELSVKIKRSMTVNALKCKYNGGRIPLGYKLSPDRKLKSTRDGECEAQVVEANVLRDKSYAPDRAPPRLVGRTA